MRNAKNFMGRTVLVCGVALTLTAIPVRAWPHLNQGTQYQSQSQNDQNRNDNYQDRNDNDGARQDVANFDRFLDTHPAIEQDLESNPSLVNDANYLEARPELQAYLNAHVQIRAQLQENPNRVIRQESRFEGRQADRDEARGQRPNPDLNQREVGRMDQFFDDHPGVEQQLQQNPSLINDANFLAQHPDLQTFVNAHPRVRAEFAENPSYFMQRENRYEGSEADRDRTNGGAAASGSVRTNGQANGQMNGQQSANAQANAGARAQEDARADANGNADLNEREVGRMDQFFDDHPKIESDLTKNPSLINDNKFLDRNRDLRAFLSEHPQIRAEFAENPNYFMHREDRFEGSAADRDRMSGSARANGQVNGQANGQMNGQGSATAQENARGANPNPDLNQQQVGLTDQFFDDHPKIEKQLEKNPSLINNDKFVNHNRDLSRFLNEHPEVREEFAGNPNYFMHRENRFEGTARDRNADRDRMNGSARANGQANGQVNGQGSATAQENADQANPNPDLNRQQVGLMDQFLDDHAGIEKQLEKNPSLINNDKYVDNHKDLDRFLSQHPEVREEFAENPNYFMHRENRFEGTARDRNADRDADRGTYPDRDNDRDAADMHKFLEKHKDVAKDLDRDPGRASDERYLSHHKDLRRFFDQHEHARAEFARNPHNFMNREHRFDRDNDHRLENRQMDKNRNKNLKNRENLDRRNQ